MMPSHRVLGGRPWISTPNPILSALKMADVKQPLCMQGYLLKRNREYRKANVLGQKYKRRWVELTNDTLVYASSQQDVLAGKIQVYAIHEISWIRRDSGSNMFTVRFPERDLTFKSENANPVEAERWVEALEAARKGRQQAQHTKSSAGQIEKLKKTAEASLLHDLHSGLHEDLIPAARYGAHSAGEHGVISAPLALVNSLPRLSSITAEAAIAVPSHHQGNRPPSPRALLANPLAAAAFVSTSKGPPGAAPAAGSIGAGYAGRGSPGKGMHVFGRDYDPGADDREDEDDDPEEVALVAPAPRRCHQRQGEDGNKSGQWNDPGGAGRRSLEQATDSFHLAKPRIQSGRMAAMREGGPGSSSSPGRSSLRCSFDAVVDAKDDGDAVAAHAAAFGEESPSKRGKVTRTKTPGFMLVSQDSTASSPQESMTPSPLNSSSGASLAAAAAAAVAGTAPGDELLLIESHCPIYYKASRPSASDVAGAVGSRCPSSRSPAASAGSHSRLTTQEEQQQPGQQFQGSPVAPAHKSLEADLDEVLTLHDGPCSNHAAQLQPEHFLSGNGSNSTNNHGTKKGVQQPASPLNPRSGHVHHLESPLCSSSPQDASGIGADKAVSLASGIAVISHSALYANQLQAARTVVLVANPGGSNASEGKLQQGWLQEDWDDSDGEDTCNAATGPQQSGSVLNGSLQGSAVAGGVGQQQQQQQQCQEQKQQQSNQRRAQAPKQANVPEPGTSCSAPGVGSLGAAQGSSQWLHEDWDEED